MPGRRRTSFLSLCALALLLCAASAAAQWNELTWVDPRLEWRTLDSEHFHVHFAERHRPQARLVADVAEALYPGISARLDWRARERIHLVLLDSADFANGFASPVPFNYSGIFLSPPDEGELLQSREWLELVLTHELVHVVHLDKALGPPDQLRRIFGRVPVFFPNALQPRWVVEGLAVDAESDPGRGYGRLGQSYFEGMMRAEVARGLRSLREVNAEGRRFPLNREYLYGGYFFAFLREQYGPEALRRLIESYSANIIPFKVDSSALAATGKTMEALWTEYHNWLRSRFTPKPDEQVPGEALARAFAISSPTLTADGVRWYIRGDGYTAPKLVRQARDGTPEAVRSVEQDTRLAAAPGGGVIAAQADICENYNYYYDLYQVAARDDWRRLTHCARFRFAGPYEDGRIAALRVTAGEAEVVMLGRDGAEERVLYRAARGEALTGLAAAGGAVFVTSQRGGQGALIELVDGRARTLLSDEAVKHSPRAADGEIYFVADYGKVYDVWSLHPGSRILSRWTRAPNGVREISAPRGGEMLVTTIEADGDALRLHRLPAQPLERREVPLEPERETPRPGDPQAYVERRYSPWPSVRPHAWLPAVQIGDGAVELGVSVFGQDALGLHRYLFSPRYEVTEGEALVDLEYTYDGRHGLLLSRWMTVEVEDEAYSIKERGQWVSTWRALSLNRRFYWGLGGALERERLHVAGVGSSPVQDERVLGLVAGIDTRRQRWLSEGPSEGQQLRLFAETSRGLGGTYSGNVYRADWRGHVPLRKTVLALRWNEAYGEADAEPFQLGGSFSDDAFTLPLLNDREFALRGYTSGAPELTGRRARVTTVEWRMPLADVDRHRVVPPVGLNRISLNLFADVGAAWEPGTRPDYHRGFGMEVMSELRIGYLFGIHARAGIARGVDETGKTTGYLRVGRSF